MSAKTIYNRAEDLTVLECNLIMTATMYAIRPNGCISLHVPNANGYALWWNNDKDFIENAETFLKQLSIKKLNNEGIIY